MSSPKYLLAFALVASLACSAFAVHCYLCESSQNPKCGEHFESEDSMKVDCSRISAPLYLVTLLTGRNVNATGCMKQTVETTLGNSHILRSCYFGDISNTQTGCKVDPINPFMKQLSCDVCADNLCNGSSSMAPMAVAIVLFFGLARIFS